MPTPHSRVPQGHKWTLTSSGFGRSPNFLGAESDCCAGDPSLPVDTSGTERATASKISFCMAALARPIWARANAAASLPNPRNAIVASGQVRMPRRMEYNSVTATRNNGQIASEAARASSLVPLTAPWRSETW